MVLTPLEGEVKGNDYDGENEVFGAKYNVPNYSKKWHKLMTNTHQ